MAPKTPKTPKTPKAPKTSERRLSREARRRVLSDEAAADGYVDAVQLFVERRLRKALSKAPPSVRATQVLLGGLESSLKEAGLPARVAKLRRLFEAAREAAAQEFESSTGGEASLDRLRPLRALVDDRLRMVSQRLVQYLSSVRTAAIDAAISGAPLDIEAVLDRAGGRLWANLKTEVRTAMMVYNRIAHLESSAAAGIEEFLYVGPDDEVTRKFCRERVGKVFGIEEIESWDNGQGLPAAVYCGGYNCRHHLRPVSKELAKKIRQQQQQSPS